MNQTQNLKLSQWEKDDRILMDDFNGDNSKIDEAVGELSEKVEMLGRAVPELVRYVGQLGFFAKLHEKTGLGQRTMYCETFEMPGLYTTSGGAKVQNNTVTLSGQNASGSVSTAVGLSLGRGDWTRVQATVWHSGGTVGLKVNGTALTPQKSFSGISSTGVNCIERDFEADMTGSGTLELELDLETGRNSSMTVYELCLFFC